MPTRRTTSLTAEFLRRDGECYRREQKKPIQGITERYNGIRIFAANSVL